jgi:hypothetical protein
MEWAHFIQELVEPQYPHVAKSRLGLDTRHTPTNASLYEALEPTAANRIADT